MTKFRAVFGMGIFSVFAVIGVFLHSNSETVFFSVILGLWVIFVIMFVGHFPDLCFFIF